MTIINGWKIKFGEFIGSTYAFNQLKKLFDEEFQTNLFLNEYDSNLCITIQDEEMENEEYLKMMYYFIKGYCVAHKSISFHTSNIFK